MIPDITEILQQVATGQLTRGQAYKLIMEHIEIAVARAANRDMFAAHAMTALYAQDGRNFEKTGEAASFAEIAEDAYHLADAMLHARG